MKTDNTLKQLSKITLSMNDLIVNELDLRGYSGIVPSHGDILISLYKNGKMSMQDISVRINRSASTVTALVNKLVKFGYVSTARCCNDSRSTVVQLTALGEELQPVFMDISTKIFDKFYSGFSDEEREIFRILLEKMYSKICGK